MTLSLTTFWKYATGRFQATMFFFVIVCFIIKNHKNHKNGNKLQKHIQVTGTVQAIK